MTATENSTAATRILIVGPNWVGDMMMAQSLFITLKQRNPSCNIDVLAPAWTAPMLSMMPEVSEAIEIPVRRGELGLSIRYTLGKQLRNNQYDQAILLPNSLKSALIPFFANIPKRTGFVGEQRWGLLNDIFRLDKNSLPMTVQRFVALAMEKDTTTGFDCPVPTLKINQQELEKVCIKFSLQKRTNKILGLCPGAEFGPAKCWPAEHYAAVAREKLKQGWDVWLFGSGKDQVITGKINLATRNACKNLSGRTSLFEAANLLSLCDSVVTNDSGLMHVAAALDRKLVAIYGSSDPGFTPPMNKYARILSLSLECAPCFKRQCPLGHTRCLQDLSPQQVLAELDSFQALLPKEVVKVNNFN